MPSPCRWRNTHQSKKIVILYLKETGIDIKSSVNQNTHTHTRTCAWPNICCNKPRTWLVGSTIAAQSVSEWRISNDTCLKPNKKGALRRSWNQIMPQELPLYLRFSEIFLNSPTHLHKQHVGYLKIGNNCFLQCSYHFISQTSSYHLMLHNLPKRAEQHH
jgi:hypothetical protein